jgi:hypothetical protein
MDTKGEAESQAKKQEKEKDKIWMYLEGDGLHLLLLNNSNESPFDCYRQMWHTLHDIRVGDMVDFGLALNNNKEKETQKTRALRTESPCYRFSDGAFWKWFLLLDFDSSTATGVPRLLIFSDDLTTVQAPKPVAPFTFSFLLEKQDQTQQHFYIPEPFLCSVLTPVCQEFKNSQRFMDALRRLDPPVNTPAHRLLCLADSQRLLKEQIEKQLQAARKILEEETGLSYIQKELQRHLAFSF